MDLFTAHHSSTALIGKTLIVTKGTIAHSGLPLQSPDGGSLGGHLAHSTLATVGSGHHGISLVSSLHSHSGLIPTTGLQPSHGFVPLQSNSDYGLQQSMVPHPSSSAMASSIPMPYTPTHPPPLPWPTPSSPIGKIF